VCAWIRAENVECHSPSFQFYCPYLALVAALLDYTHVFNFLFVAATPSCFKFALVILLTPFIYLEQLSLKSQEEMD
jgi:hypothetical protein